MADFTIPNQALCKYKGNTSSPDDIPNFNNKGLKLSRDEDIVGHMWVGIPLSKELPQNIRRCRLYIYDDKNLNSNKQRIGIYYSNTENGNYTNYLSRKSFLTNEHTNEIFTFTNSQQEYYNTLQFAKSIGIVIMHRDASATNSKFGTPEVIIEKIEFCDVDDNVLETISFYDYALDSTPFLTSENDTAMIVDRGEIKAKNKLKVSKGDIYTFNNEGYIWDGNHWRYLGKNTNSKFDTLLDPLELVNEIDEEGNLTGNKAIRLQQDWNTLDINNDGQIYVKLGDGLGYNENGICVSESYIRSLLGDTALIRDIYPDRAILENDEPPYEIYPSNVIYMIPSETEDGAYDEYMNVNNKWELIGSTKVDLSNYQTKTDENLTTNSKEVIGAINELKTLIDTLTQSITSTNE